MPLISRNNFPPGGFPYREPKLNWSSPRDGAPFNIRVQQMQAVRVANPASGLDPSWDACALALDEYTCARIGYDPTWCVSPADPMAKAIAAARKPAKCGGCGQRRARTK